jgi:hypothetical protein
MLIIKDSSVYSFCNFGECHVIFRYSLLYMRLYLRKVELIVLEHSSADEPM